MNPETIDRVLAGVDDSMVIDLACELTNLYSPTGHEREIAEYLYQVLKDLGLRAKLQPLSEDSANAVGLLAGDGTGPTLMFNGHLDVSHTQLELAIPGGDYSYSQSVPDSAMPPGYRHAASIDGDWIYGSGVYNMKSAMAAYIGATAAIMAATKLRGDIVIAGVAGEIEKSAVDDYQGAVYSGYGVGTRWLLAHGVSADACVVGEPTGLDVTVEHVGSLWIKLATRGTISHTAWASKGANAIEDMCLVIKKVRAWADRHSKEHQFAGVTPGVNIGSIVGGHPWRASRTPVFCNLYVDVRFSPNQSPLDIERQLRLVLAGIREESGIDVELELVAYSPAFKESESQPIVQAITEGHTSVAVEEPNVVGQGWCSDAPSLQAAGIPTVVYGPGGKLRGGEQGWVPDDVSRGLGEGEHQSIPDLLKATRVYAVTALRYCSLLREDVV